jgi:hypothetical protein
MMSIGSITSHHYPNPISNTKKVSYLIKGSPRSFFYLEDVEVSGKDFKEDRGQS